MYKRSVFEIFMPYCIEQSNENHYYILNRHYNPVGIFDQDVTRGDYPRCLVELKGLTENRARKLSARGDSSFSSIYLYNESCHPLSSKAAMDNYLERLRILAKLKIVSNW